MLSKELIQAAEMLVQGNQESIARVESEICNIGCSWCSNCSGIVGG